jgi:glutaryl-CoA dehydrogenase
MAQRASHAKRMFGSGTVFEKFNFEDAFDLNGQLTEEERMISEVAKNFAQEKLMPRIREAYNKEHFDLAIMKEYGELGFLGCTIKDYGLPGVSSTAYGKL